MKKTILKIMMLVVVLILLMSVIPTQSEAQMSYTPLEPLPGIEGGPTTLEKYIPAVFSLAIGLSAVVAVLMIVIGGFQYMSSDAIQGKSDGKARIKNAIIALVFVICAWLILWTINPDLLVFNFNLGL